MHRRRIWIGIGLVVLLLLIFGSSIVGLYTDWLWFGEVGYQSVFSTRVVTRLILGLIAGALFFAIVYFNARLARRFAPVIRMSYDDSMRARVGRIAQQGAWAVVVGAVLFLTLMVALQTSTRWLGYQMFTHPTPFGIDDPVFGRDVGFYVFQLGFLHYIYGWLFFALIVATLTAVAVYIVDRGIYMRGESLNFEPHVKAHLSVMVALMLFLKAWGYRLGAYNLLFSPTGVVYGPGYADVHARLIAYSILTVVAIIAGIIALVNIRRRGISLPIAAVVILVAASFLIGVVYPGLVQQFYVKPNEIARESEYIRNNIEFTRRAFNLDATEVRNFSAAPTLTPQNIQANRATINSIRLWDYRPIETTYNQLQALGPYYRIANVDVDRYTIGNELRQVMLASRELTLENATGGATSWVNKHFQYTHGYGVVMSPVNRATAQGLPEFFISGMPPTSRIGINVDTPQIYFGEMTDEYAIVNSNAQEFDYPAEGQPKYTKYSGKGGIPITGFLRRLLFAWRFGEESLVLTNPITSESRLMFRRSIGERVNHILPFLTYDQDPYMVISGGKLYWIQDAYTTSENYPYSTPNEVLNQQGYRVDSFNYIRNSLKVVIDAYEGTVDYYVADTADPIVQTFGKVFPGVFKPLAEMPEDLRRHVRYPEFVFRTQARMLLAYHMLDPQVFYNKGDLWAIPNEIVGTSGVPSEMEPYYVVMSLPGETTEDFLMMLPFTPANKDNMVAWMAAKSSPDEYGKMVLYQFPRGTRTPGPAQVESMINQDAAISPQLSLWDREGSRVNRGNQIVIPIENSILYVKPLYLESETSQIPELKRVVVVYDDQVQMAETLEAALNAIFGRGAAPATPTEGAARPATPTPTPTPGQAPQANVQRLIDQAVSQYEAAEEAQRRGDWAAYGEQQRRLRETLRQLQQQQSGR